MKSTVIHEVREGLHRIVIVHDDSTNDAGEWTPTDQVAVHGKYFSIQGDHVLPQGVFTVKVVPHQVLA